MTQKQKDLLLKDLCGRLPYGVKCAEVYPDGNKFENVWDIIRISKYVEDGIHISNCKTTYGYCSSIENIKPYLFPLSSITEEQKKEFDDTLKYFPSEEIYFWTSKTYDWCDKNNFDYRGLIEKDLALDAT